MERVVHILVEVVEQLSQLVDEGFVGKERLALAGFVRQHLELPGNDASLDEFLHKTVVYVFVGARVEATGHKEHTVLGEHDVVEKFLCLFAVCSLGNFAEFLPNRVLVYLDDVEESGGAFCLSILDERELLVVTEVEECVGLFGVRGNLLILGEQILHDVNASLRHVVVVVGIVGLPGDDIAEIILHEFGQLLGGDVTLLQVYLVFALCRQPNRVGWIRVVAHTPYTTAETQVTPSGKCADIGTAVHAKFEVGNGIEVEVALLELLGDGINGTLGQTDAKTAGVCTRAARQVGHHYGIVYLINAQLLEEGVDVGEILLRDVAYLYLFLFGEAQYVIAIVGHIFRHLGEEVGGVVAVAQGNVGVP